MSIHTPSRPPSHALWWYKVSILKYLLNRNAVPIQGLGLLIDFLMMLALKV